MKTKLVKYFLYFFSRPLFFSSFYFIHKLCLYGMNRVSASFLEPEHSGEKEALKWLNKRLAKIPVVTFFDVGGNYGTYTDLVLKIFPKNNLNIHIFEPSQVCFNFLVQKFEKLKFVKIHQMAVSDVVGYANLFYPWQGAGSASLSANSFEANSDDKIISEKVKLITLDSFCVDYNIEKIHYLKLDIEGFELDALIGIKNMIAKGNVEFIQFEIGVTSLQTKSNLLNIWNLLHVYYDFFLVLNQGIIQISYKPDLECFLGASNFLIAKK